jgi:hypothetical protein
LGQASWTQVPQTCLRASCRGVIGRPQRPQRCPAARAALPSHPAGSAPTQLSPIGPEPVTGSPKPPGQKCSRCAWRTRSPTGTRSRPCPDAFLPARPALRTTGSPRPPPWRSRSAILILSSPGTQGCPSHRRACSHPTDQTDTGSPHRQPGATGWPGHRCRVPAPRCPGARAPARPAVNIRQPGSRPDDRISSPTPVGRWRGAGGGRVLPSSKPLPPFPMCRALPGSEYYGGSAAPGPFSGRRAYPGAGPDARYREPRPDGSRVHCHSLGGGGARLCHGGLATGTPQSLPVASRACSSTLPGSSRRNSTRRDAPRLAPICQVRADVEVKDVTAPVPRVLLSATLAGHAPSGSTGTSRRCRGCSRPRQHHPDQAAPSYTALLRQDGGEGLSPPLE